MNACANFFIQLYKGVYLFAKTVCYIVLWPFIMIYKRYCSEVEFNIAYGHERFENQMERRDDMIASSRARMIEVCIESSFQPLLQLYLLLPTLIHYFECGAFKQVLKRTVYDSLSKLSGAANSSS